MRGIVYWHPSLYRAAIKRLYRQHYADRYERISRLIPDGSEVLELCMGDAHLFSAHLRQRDVRYTGIDFNPAFVRNARRQGIDARLADIRAEAIPEADCIVMHGSLYHFIPDHERLLERMLEAARRRLIVAEPVENLSAGRGFMAFASRIATSAGGGTSTERLDAERLDAAFRRFPERLERILPSAGGRERIGVFGPRVAA